MKKWLSLLLCVVVMMGVSGCRTESVDEDGALNVITGKLSDYIVMKENTAYVYRGDTDSIADYVYYVEHTGEGMLQRRVSATNESFAEVYRFNDEALELVYTEGKYYRHENLLDMEDNAYVQWIGKPLKSGAKWTYTAQPSGAEVTIAVTATNVDVTVPYGTFKAIELTKTYSDSPDYCAKEYYAKGVGLIKQTSISTDFEVSSELCEVHENVAMNTSVPLFSMENGERVHEFVDISYSTNTDIMELYNSIFPQFFAEKFGMDEAALHLTKAVVDYAWASNPVLTLTFVDAFSLVIPPENAVQCMVDTFAYLYGIAEVRLSTADFILLFNDIEQDEEGIMMYIPLEDLEVGASDTDFEDMPESVEE